MKKRIISISISIVLGYAAFVGMLYLFQRDFLYHPPTAATAQSYQTWLQGFKTIKIQTADGLTLESWFTKPEGAKKPVIVAFHGNADHAANMAYTLAKPLADGYGLLLVEYRGYAGNPGMPTEEGLYHDARAAIDWLKKTHPERPVVLYGHSLGTGVAVQMATEYDAKALILDSPFDSALAVAQGVYFYVPFLSWLMKDQFLNDEKIKSVKAPVLFLLGERDTVIPIKHGLRLAGLANHPKTIKIYSQGTHVDLMTSGADKDMAAFLKEVFK